MGKDREPAGRVLVEDRRSNPLWIGEDALDRIAETFSGRKLPVARSIYLAVIRLASAGGAVEAPRADVATEAGCTKKALDDYVPELEAAGVIAVERRADGHGGNLPNVWVVLDLREGATQGSPGGRHPDAPSHADDPVQTSSLLDGEEGCRGKGAGKGEGRRLVAGEFEFPGIVPPDMAADANELLRRKTRVDGRQVTLDEVTKAACAVAAFNRESGSEFGLGAHLRSIVMRIRERPSYTFDAHVRLVESAWRLKWWEKRSNGRRRGRPTPAVIYGHAGVFENVVQDAVAEKKGEAVAPAPASQFERTKGSVEDEEL